MRTLQQVDPKTLVRKDRIVELFRENKGQVGDLGVDVFEENGEVFVIGYGENVFGEERASGFEEGGEFRFERFDGIVFDVVRFDLKRFFGFVVFFFGEHVLRYVQNFVAKFFGIVEEGF